MALTPINTEKVPGRITHVYIGSTSDTGIDIQSGIKSFSYERVHDARRQFVANTKTAATELQPHSHFTWKLEFLSDCRTAFFATDVDNGTAGNQYALDDNGNSTKIDYFRVIMPIISGTGTSMTRTYTLTNGFCLRNRTRVGDDEDAVYTYEGDAEEITYADS